MAPDPTTLVEPAVLDCWPEILDAVESALAGADVLVVSGSVPRRRTGRRPGRAGLGRSAPLAVPVVVDTQGPWLLSALAAGATVVKPNVHELAATTGDDDPVRAARTLARSVGGDRRGLAGRGRRDRGNGDRRLGGAAGGRAGRQPHRRRRRTGRRPGARAAARPRGGRRTRSRLLHDAVALSAAAVLSPEAGDVDPAHHREQRDGVVVRALDGAR